MTAVFGAIAGCMGELLPALDAVALAVHAGGLVVFASLLNFRGGIAFVRDEDLVRVFRSFGAGFGLSLGVLMATGVYLHVTAVHPGEPLPAALALRFDDPAARLMSLRSLCLFALWVSYIRLEVWTVEPCRKLDTNGVVSDPPAYAVATRRLAGHLALNAALAVAVVACGALAARA